MFIAFDRHLDPEVGRPEPTRKEPESSLNITVVHTSVNATIAALSEASNLARSLEARITLIVPQVVPYPLSLNHPPLSLEFQRKRFHELAAPYPVDITVELYLCRDGEETVQRVLKPHSLVIVGGRMRIWPTAAKRLTRQLRKLGHEVILAEAG